MIEAIASQPPDATRRSSPQESGAASGFSFALAAAALERNAGAALAAHGAAPTDAIETATSGKRTLADTSSQETGRRAVSDHAPSQTRADNAAERASPVMLPAAKPAPTSSLSAAIDAPATAPAQAFATLAIAPPTVAATARLAAGADGAPPREIAATRTENLARSQKPAAIAQPQPTQELFARLLARRLDSGATAFQLRLDPPELGRVDARLVVGEDGKATLALKFDNQAAHDLFARDEAGLRAALAGAGFDLGGSGLSFSLDRDAPGTGAAAAGSVRIADVFPEPEALAPLSRGLIDLRI